MSVSSQGWGGEMRSASGSRNYVWKFCISWAVVVTVGQTISDNFNMAACIVGNSKKIESIAQL